MKTLDQGVFVPKQRASEDPMSCQITPSVFQHLTLPYMFLCNLSPTCGLQNRFDFRKPDFVTILFCNLSRLTTKPTKWLCAQRRLRSAWASAQSNQSLRCALRTQAFMRTAKTDQTGRVPRLIWVIAGRTATLLILSCRGSFQIIFVLAFRTNTYSDCYLEKALSQKQSVEISK